MHSATVSTMKKKKFTVSVGWKNAITERLCRAGRAGHEVAMNQRWRGCRRRLCVRAALEHNPQATADGDGYDLRR